MYYIGLFFDQEPVVVLDPSTIYRPELENIDKEQWLKSQGKKEEDIYNGLWSKALFIYTPFHYHLAVT